MAPGFSPPWSGGPLLCSADRYLERRGGYFSLPPLRLVWETLRDAKAGNLVGEHLGAGPAGTGEAVFWLFPRGEGGADFHLRKPEVFFCLLSPET